MQNFLRIAQGVDVGPLALELHRAPHLWDQNTTRKTYVGSPHTAMSDIWVRFRPVAELDDHNAHKTEYRCTFWPAWRELPALRPLVFGMMSAVSSVEMGSIIITRLPPGCDIEPHDDRGSWAAEYYNCKLHLTVAGESMSVCDGDTVAMSQGEVWTFDNLKIHSVHNPGPVDRIAVIVSMRCET